MEVPWLCLAVTFSLVVDAFSIYISLRQEKRYRCDKKVTPELEGIVTPKQFKESCAYHGDSMRFGLVHSVCDTIVDTLILLCGVFPFIWDKCETWVGLERSEAVKSVAFILVITVIKMIEGIPWDLYSTFVIEERHGFNKSTLGLFFKDLLTSLGLTVVLTCLLVPPFIWVVRWAGPHGFIYVWLLCLFVTLVATFLVPILVLPLFNKFEPLKDEELRKEVEDLAKEVSYPLAKLYQMDASKRSAHSNAFMYGFWKNKRIVLFDTLLHAPREEILAILAHEIGHWKLGHTLKNLALGSAVLFVQLWVAQIFIFQEGPYRSFGFHNTNAVIIGAFIFSCILNPLNYVLNVAVTILSRKHEFEADAFAAHLGRGEALKSGLIRIGVENKMAYNVDWLYAWITYSHPTLAERLHGLDVQIKKGK